MSSLQPMLSLLGVLSPDESRRHLDQITGSQIYAEPEARHAWEKSRESYTQVHPYPGLPETSDLPSEAWAHLLDLPRHESFALLVRDFAWATRLVEIDALFSVAIDISVRRVEEWHHRFSTLDRLGIIQACLPSKAESPRLGFQPPRASFVHEDLGATWGYPRGGLGLAMLLPPLPVRVVEIAGYLYLMDGYHRAVALRKLGRTHIPALVILDANWSLLRDTPRPRRFEPPPFSRSNPPCVGHFVTLAAVPTRAVQQVRVMTMYVDSYIAPVHGVSPETSPTDLSKNEPTAG